MSPGVRHLTEILIGGVENRSIINIGDHGIYAIESDGTNLHRLDPEGVADYSPVWSPDGQQIAFTRMRTPSQGATLTTATLMVMNADGSDARELTDSMGVALNPVWSPDGTQIAFERVTNNDDPEERWLTKTAVMNADGTNQHDIGPGFVIGGPSWSPEGSQLVFAGSTQTGPLKFEDLQISLYVAKPDGTGLRALFGPGILLTPSWSPSGAAISFLKYTAPANNPGGAVPDSPSLLSIWTIGTDGSNPRQVSGDQFRIAEFPAWSPDGAQIAFVGGDAKNSGIYLMNADGSNTRALAQGLLDGQGMMVMAPGWSIDGNAVAYLGAAIEPDATEATLATGELHVVTTDGSNNSAILKSFYVEPAFDPFDTMGSTAPVWQPVQP